MHKLSIAEAMLAYQGFEEDVEQIARAGVRGIGVNRGKLDAFGVEKGVRLIRDAGLEVSGYMSTGRFLEGPESEQVDDAKRCLETAALLQAGCLYVLPGAPGKLTWEEANKRVTDGLSKIVPMAREHGVLLAYEPIHPILRHLGHIHRLGDALDLVRQFDSLGVVVDLWHLWWDQHFLDDIRQGVDRIAVVQIADHDPSVALERRIDRAPLGEGVIPLKQILHAIDGAGFTGYYDVEVITKFTDEQKRTIVADSKAAFEKLWE